jgi:GDPmannose 4,6-dehydratase
MKAIIFGANGQDGPYVAGACMARGFEPVGVDRNGAGMKADVAEYNAVTRLVTEHRPALIVHLAALSTTSHDALFENHAAISTGTLNILEAVYRARLDAKVFIAGSGVQFQNTGAPISEESPFAATSPYAVARIQSVYAARYFRTLGVKTYVGYLFHHESPRRPSGHVSRDVVDAVARIANGAEELLDIGDLTIRKEWTFAGDVAEAILTLVSQDMHHEAVIGSGELHSIEEWVAQCFSLRGLDWRQYVRTIHGFKAEYPTLLSDPRRMYSLGWRPKVSFGALAAMMSGL